MNTTINDSNTTTQTSGKQGGTVISDPTEGAATKNSPKRLARIAGVLYLLVAIFGGFAQGFVYPKIYVVGDAASTAGNILANSALVRFGIVADMFQATVLVFVAITLYRLLKHVNQSVAGLMVILASIGAGIMCFNVVFEFEALRVATGAVNLATIGNVGSNGLVMLLVDAHHYGLLIAQIFFGLWLLPMGYLAFKSGMFVKPLGVLLILAGISYIVDLLAAFLLPEVSAQIHGLLSIPPSIAEPWMVLYLLIIGVKTLRSSRNTLAADAIAGRKI